MFSLFLERLVLRKVGEIRYIQVLKIPKPENDGTYYDFIIATLFPSSEYHGSTSMIGLLLDVIYLFLVTVFFSKM